MSGKRVVFYELNEVPWKVFDHFAAVMPAGPLGELRRRARGYTTWSPDGGHLSPWITWPTVHRGVADEAHRITDFGVDLAHVDRDFPPIWDLLSRRGVRVGVFGSLHSHPLPDNVEDYAFYVPDTFAAGPECFPAKFEAFQAFNLRMTGLNARTVTGAVALRDAARFVAAAPGLGLRGRTVASLAHQLARERVRPERLVRRRTSQVQLAFDFYLRALADSEPDISFFFTNHVASSMHRYWPALFPEDDPEARYDGRWRRTWGDEIPFTMREASRQLGALMRYVERRPDTVLVVATSMGQAAVPGRARVDREIVLRDAAAFMTALGLAPAEWAKRPAMVPQYNFWVSPAAKARLLSALARLRINGEPIAATDLGGDIVKLEYTHPNQDAVRVTVDGVGAPAERFGLANVEVPDGAGSNAYHVPNGMLLVYDPRARAPSGPRDELPTTAVAPALLTNFGLAPPSYMRGTSTPALW